jgi:hypothetical protein
MTECQNYRIYFINTEELSIYNLSRAPEVQPHCGTCAQNELGELPVSDPAELAASA